MNQFWIPTKILLREVNYSEAKWITSKVTTLNSTFCGSEFTQDISNWDIGKAVNVRDMFFDCPIKEQYKPKFT